MNKKKQIEEMAKDLDACPFLQAPIGCDQHEGSIAIAEYLYNADYRKDTDVAGEIFEEIEKEIKLALDSNYKVKRDAQDDNDTLVIYVEGKIDCLRGLLGFLDELKKKYTEES